MHRKILIICFTFPPYNGIGGRRWAKFAKYLVALGFDVEVVASKKQGKQNSPWTKDTQSYKTTFINGLYPKVLMGIPENILEKLWYKLSLILVRLLSKGNPYDHSLYFDYFLIPFIEKKIKSGVSHLIVSVAPFNIAYKLVALKQKYPKTNFIVDFRDPWTNNKTSFGYEGLSKKRFDYEQFKEKEVVNRYDKVISVSEEMSDYFKSLLEFEKEKCITIPNGFDIEDIKSVEVKKSKKDKCRFIFTGTLYDKAMHMFKLFCDTLIDIMEELPEIKNKIQIDFFGYVPNEFNDLSSKLDFINFKGTLTSNKVYEEIQNSDFALLFLTDDLNYSFSTKFYEYIAMNTSIVVVSKEGYTGSYVESNQLGYAISESNAKEKFKMIYNDWLNNCIITNSDYNYKNHEISNITQNQLLNLLN